MYYVCTMDGTEVSRTRKGREGKGTEYKNQNTRKEKGAEEEMENCHIFFIHLFVSFLNAFELFMNLYMSMM